MQDRLVARWRGTGLQGCRVAEKVEGTQGSRSGRAPGDHPAKKLSKAASEPVESGSGLAVPPLNIINAVTAKTSQKSDFGLTLLY